MALFSRRKKANELEAEVVPAESTAPAEPAAEPTEPSGERADPAADRGDADADAGPGPRARRLRRTRQRPQEEAWGPSASRSRRTADWARSQRRQHRSTRQPRPLARPPPCAHRARQRHRP